MSASLVRSIAFNVARCQMEEVVFLKFTQHADLKDELLRTGNADLVEASLFTTFIAHVSLSCFKGLPGGQLLGRWFGR